MWTTLTAARKENQCGPNVIITGTAIVGVALMMDIALLKATEFVLVISIIGSCFSLFGLLVLSCSFAAVGSGMGLRKIDLIRQLP